MFFLLHWPFAAQSINMKQHVTGPSPHHPDIVSLMAPYRACPVSPTSLAFLPFLLLLYLCVPFALSSTSPVPLFFLLELCFSLCFPLALYFSVSPLALLPSSLWSPVSLYFLVFLFPSHQSAVWPDGTPLPSLALNLFSVKWGSLANVFNKALGQPCPVKA